MYYLFRTNTTGLIKPKKARPIATYEEALSAGRALNIIDGTPDRVFIIIPLEHLQCHTNITDPLPFSEAFFRLPRLSDSRSKFANGPQINKDDFDLTEKGQTLAGLNAATQMNPMHPALAQSLPATERLADKSIYEILSGVGLTKANLYDIQNQIQFDLGLVPLARQLTLEQQAIIYTIKQLFTSLQEANTYLSSLAMARMNNFGETATCKSIPFPSSLTE